MTQLKGALLAAITFVMLLGTFLVLAFIQNYPEGFPLQGILRVVAIVGAGILIWAFAAFLITRLPDDG